ncbi:hypothetical protein LTS18_007449, partial [Coniosporium uncinatum]
MTNARSFAAQLLARLSEAEITAGEAPEPLEEPPEEPALEAPVAAGQVTPDDVAPQVELGTALVAAAAVTLTAL